MSCLQDDCANWDGDGCPCRVLDVEPVDVRLGSDGLTPEERLLRAIFGAPCSGASDCPAPVHEHGCYADLDGTACTDPEEHDASANRTPPASLPPIPRHPDEPGPLVKQCGICAAIGHTSDEHQEDR